MLLSFSHNFVSNMANLTFFCIFIVSNNSSFISQILKLGGSFHIFSVPQNSRFSNSLHKASKIKLCLLKAVWMPKIPHHTILLKSLPQNHMIYTVYIIVLNTDSWGDSVGRQIPLIETIEGWRGAERQYRFRPLLDHVHFTSTLVLQFKLCSLPTFNYPLFFHTVFDIEYSSETIMDIRSTQQLHSPERNLSRL